MDFSEAQFRRAVRNPDAYVRDAQSPMVKQEGGSPQRPWLIACLRAYFNSGRVPAVAFDDLERRIARSESNRRAANAAATRPMLVWFVARDQGEDAPEIFFPEPSDVAMGTNLVTLRPSLVYGLGRGCIIRHLWTEVEFSLSQPYAQLAAAGYLMHAEASLGIDVVQRIDFWHLRKRQSASWRRSDLQSAKARLIRTLDDVARGIEKTGDPGAAA